MGVFLVFSICMVRLVLLPHLLPPAAAQQNHTNITTPSPLLGLTSTLLLTPTKNSFWVSPTNVFALGFLETPSSNSSNFSTAPSFTLSLFYSSLSQFQLTSVWTPHRGRLVSQNAILNFTAQGDLVLSDSGQQIWHTGTTGVTTVLVSDEGYVSLSGKNSSTVWRSWDEPITDTLLPGQALASGTDVVDNEGRYLLRVQTDSNFVLYFLGSLTTMITNHYWDAGTWDMNVTQAYYNASQGLMLIDNSTEHTIQVLLQASSTTKLERIVLSGSGTLTRYMLSADGKSWFVAAQVPSSTCYVLGLCGPYGICMDDQQNNTSTNFMDNYNCTCPPGFYYIDLSIWFAGCGTDYPLDCDKGSKLTSLPGVQYGATYSTSTPSWDYYHYSSDLSTLDQCAELCNSSCQCAAATYDGQSCHLSSVGQVNSGNMQMSTYVTLLKTSVDPAENSTHTYLSGQATVDEPRTKRVLSRGAAVGIGGALGFAIIAGFANLAWLYYIRSRQTDMEKEDFEADEDELPLLGRGGPVQFSYKELKVASNGFKSLVGRGGFGPVYKGVLAGGVQIAIKRLQGSNFGEKQFRAEVVTIGSVHHMNLVRLRGYCAKGPHRMLVYEFMPRGSLNSYIFRDNKSTSNSECHTFLDWETRFQILLSTGRAIRYLHEECQPCIVHCDIKPENILLGEAFNAKVSDFGMAQLVGGEANHTDSVTRMRGTFGYMAPEWTSSRHLTPKVDVYSFGIVVLEVISGRHVVDMLTESHSHMYLHKWAYSQVRKNDAALGQILDPRLRLQFATGATQHVATSPQFSSTSTDTSSETVTTEEAAASSHDDIASELERAVCVALWCINKDPAVRPAMGLVVQVLEGIMPIGLPPNPF